MKIDRLQVNAWNSDMLLLSKPECVIGDWEENRSYFLHFLTPVKFRGGWAKFLSEFYEFGLGPVTRPLIYGGVSLGRLRD